MFYIIAGVNQYFTMRAKTLEEAYELYDLEFVDNKNNKYSI